MKPDLILLVLAFLFSVQTYSQNPTWLWAKAMNGTNDSHAMSVTIDDFDNVYTIGYFLGTVDFDPGPGTYNLTTVGSSIAPDIYISKLDDSGNFIWAKSMGGTTYGLGLGYAITLDTAGNIYATGYYGGPVDFDPGPGIFELTAGGIFIVKLDGTGNFVWANAMGDTSFDEARSITLDGSGNVYTTGRFYGTTDFDPGPETFNLTSIKDNTSDIFISKLDASGNFKWAKALGGRYLDYGNSIAIDAFDNVYTTGRFGDTIDFDPGPGTFNLMGDESGNAFILKLDSSGNFVWAKAIGENGVSSEGNCIALDPGGTGEVYITYGGSILKLDNAGNLIWAKDTGGSGEGFLALDPGGSGDVYITGYFYGTNDFDPGVGTFNLTSSGIADIFISKLDIAGNFLWVKAAGGTEDDYSSSIALNASGKVYLTGYFDSPSISFDSETINNADSTGNSSDIFIAKLDAVTTSAVNGGPDTQPIILNPNPFSNEVVIKGAKEKDVVIIFDVMGNEVMRQKTQKAETKINTEILLPGFYFLYCTDGIKSSIIKMVKF